MAYTIGINKSPNEMFNDLETLLTQEGWTGEKFMLGSSMTTSRGFTYNGTFKAEAGKYSDTVGIHLSNSASYSLTHSIYTQTGPNETFYADYPTEFSYSFWFKLPFDEIPSFGIAPIRSGSFVRPFYNTTYLRLGGGVSVSHFGEIGHTWNLASLYEQLEIGNILDNNFSTSYQHLVITFSNVLNTSTVYLNGVLITSTNMKPNAMGTYTFYATIHSFFSLAGIIFDEFIVWDKVLDATEALNLATSVTSIPVATPNVFEKYTHQLITHPGGRYTNTCDNGSKVNIQYGITSNNIYLNSFLFSASDDFQDYTTRPTTTGAGTSKYLAFIPESSATVLKKYWLVVDNNKVIIAYKLLDLNASRVTPLYQLGYMGKVNSLGNDGAAVFIAGTTTTSTTLWTTINTTSFGSGIMYSTNNMYYLGHSGYVTASVGATSQALSGFISLNNSIYLSSIQVYYSAHMIGVVDGVFVVPASSTNNEDIITINAVDYVVMDNADLGLNTYRLALKLQ